MKNLISIIVFISSSLLIAKIDMVAVDPDRVVEEEVACQFLVNEVDYGRVSYKKKSLKDIMVELTNNLKEPSERILKGFRCEFICQSELQDAKISLEVPKIKLSTLLLIIAEQSDAKEYRIVGNKIYFISPQFDGIE